MTDEEIADLVSALREYRELCKNDSKVWSPSTVWFKFEGAANTIEYLRTQLAEARSAPNTDGEVLAALKAARSDIPEIAANCHRAKWVFDVEGDSTAIKAFSALDHIGMDAKRRFERLEAALAKAPPPPSGTDVWRDENVTKGWLVDVLRTRHPSIGVGNMSEAQMLAGLADHFEREAQKLWAG